MSKIYTKTQREPYLVTKQAAEEISKDHKDPNKPPQFVLTIKHLEGVKVVTKADIRSIDITYNDKDYWDKKKEVEPTPAYNPPTVIMTEEELKRSREAMLKTKEKLKQQGFNL